MPSRISSASYFQEYVMSRVFRAYRADVAGGNAVLIVRGPEYDFLFVTDNTTGRVFQSREGDPSGVVTPIDHLPDTDSLQMLGYTVCICTGIVMEEDDPLI